jgi:hypothetical protein
MYMLLTPHTLVGIAIATNISNPILAVLTAFISHFLGDKVPHWDFYSNTKREERTVGWRPIAVMGDLAVGVAIGVAFTCYYLWVKNDSTTATVVFLSGIASVLPDALSSITMVGGKEGKFLKILNSIQSKMQFQAPLPWGIITQILVIIISLWFIKF